MATDSPAARKSARPAPVEPQAPDLDVLEDACCPITLEVFRDPVTLAQSGISYERAALEDALARQPGVDPETNKEFDGAPTIVANHTLRRLIASLSAKRDKKVDDEDDAAATNEDAAQHRPMTRSEDAASKKAPKKRGRKKAPAAPEEEAAEAPPPKKRGRPPKADPLKGLDCMASPANVAEQRHFAQLSPEYQELARVMVRQSRRSSQVPPPGAYDKFYRLVNAKTESEQNRLRTKGRRDLKRIVGEFLVNLP